MNVQIPIIDITPLCQEDPDYNSNEVSRVASAIGTACRQHGFFYIVGWESVVSSNNIRRLETMAKIFFNKTHENKMQLSMKNSGLHWKGYFPSDDELRSGRPDAKEGLYFGEPHALDSSQVKRGLAMHGPNQWPEPKGEWETSVLLYLRELTNLGLRLMCGVALSLSLPCDHFERQFLQPKPFTPFRIFSYPEDDLRQGVGRHTDYGCLTILKQDDVGGLEVEVEPGKWIQAPPLASSFVVNIGDMLELWTSGHYRATPHRVKPGLTRKRMSMPFFFDPSFDAIIDPNELREGSPVILKNAAGENEIETTSVIKYGEYITHKVSNVFPELFETSGATDRLSKL